MSRVYCAPCDIEHDQPQDCPEHDDYEPVRGLDRYHGRDCTCDACVNDAAGFYGSFDVNGGDE